MHLVINTGEVIDSTQSLVDRSDDAHTWQRMQVGNYEWQFAAGTRDELSDPEGQTSATRSAHSRSAVC